MYEENGRISWSNLFIKVIIVVIFVLFTVWLLSLSNRGISNSLSVLTDNIFAENMDRMKEVGKEYFTVERLPEEIGEVRTLTLSKMYDEKLILELKDKNGNACSAENSYVSIEKLETEYQMKVYLECGEESDYIKVIMGCYDYCDTDICEVKKEEELKNIEYEYGKTTGGSWSDWGAWSEWSKTVITKTDYRDVETKVVEENYSYVKDVVKTEYTQNAVCSDIDGYELVSNKNGKCTYEKTTSSEKNPTCPTVSGYTLAKRNGFTCSYTRNVTSESNPTCPAVSGWTNTGRNGFTCSYSQNSTVTEDPTCPAVSGWTNTGRNGFTCSYSKTYDESTDPVCPTKSGWTYTGRNGFTCSYSKVVTGSTYSLQYYSSGSGSYVPADTSTYTYVQTSADYQYKCNSTCSFKWYYTYKIYKKVYDKVTQYDSATATCPSGYSSNGSTCVKPVTNYDSRTATCPSGYSSNGSTCVKPVTNYDNRTATCPSGYTKDGSKCVKTDTLTASRTATCPSGYSKEGNSCIKYNTSEKIQNATCPTGQDMVDGKCYKDVTHKETVNETRKVTYYRYRLRSYVGGTTDYKWSKSKEDKELLNAGYKLTGKTREVK